VLHEDPTIGWILVIFQQEPIWTWR